MQHLEYWAIIVILILIIIIQQVERKDLYNRIMAGTLNEYKASTKDRKPIKNIIKRNLDASDKR